MGVPPCRPGCRREAEEHRAAAARSGLKVALEIISRSLETISRGKRVGGQGRMSARSCGLLLIREWRAPEGGGRRVARCRVMDRLYADSGRHRAAGAPTRSTCVTLRRCSTRGFGRSRSRSWSVSGSCRLRSGASGSQASYRHGPRPRRRNRRRLGLIRSQSLGATRRFLGSVVSSARPSAVARLFHSSRSFENDRLVTRALP